MLRSMPKWTKRKPRGLKHVIASNLFYKLKNTLDENEEKIDDKEDLKTLMDSLDETMEWLDGNQDAGESEINQKHSEIDSLSKPVLKSLYEAGGRDDVGFDDEL